jgi:hypothetical protein
MSENASALHLVLTGDPALFAIVRLSLIVSLSAVLFAALIGAHPLDRADHYRKEAVKCHELAKHAQPAYLDKYNEWKTLNLIVTPRTSPAGDGSFQSQPSGAAQCRTPVSNSVREQPRGGSGRSWPLLCAA